MVTMKLDPAIVVHLEWIGFVRPTGLVVSAPALVRAGAVLNRADAEGQRLLRDALQERTFSVAEGPALYAPDFRAFASQVLGWSFSAKGYAGTVDSPIPPELELTLTEYSETLRPDFAVRELEPRDGAAAWQLLVKVLDAGEDFDRIVRGGGTLESSAHSRMERLLRHTGVSAGLLFNGRSVRLVSAPRGESSGWLDFRINDMVQTAGRPISAAMRLLLRETRLLTGPRAQRLSALLEDSRKFQNEVSERLAEQVLHALYEILRGFQSAHDASKGELLREPLAKQPDDIYRALLTVMLRLVFLLFAEERDMLPEDETFLRNYSLGGLHERLREDAALYPDTMDQRYGAWAQLLVLFRMVFDGAAADGMHLPRRHGVLFDPDRYPFLEGRNSSAQPTGRQRANVPLVPDGTVYRALEKLLILDGERISYRALDVEQIGSVYETMMGFRLETANGTSIAIKAQKRHGAPTTISLESLLEQPAARREKWVQDHADRKLGSKVLEAVKAAIRTEDLHAALLPVVDLAATPDLVARGAMVLQPSDERRRSGSHYTPRTLTEPMVRTTLSPILERLRDVKGSAPRPEEILELKVCDPAMGSGAFLVEACRQLAEALLEAWIVHGGRPPIPDDEDEIVFARRLVAQRCLYGVDRNPVAVDLAKVSLWLVTLAKEHALTFLDHALRHGDSLVGLTTHQVSAFHWDPLAPAFQPGFEAVQARERLADASHLRKRIRQSSDDVADSELQALLKEAERKSSSLRLMSDLVVAAFFSSSKPKARELARSRYAAAVVNDATVALDENAQDAKASLKGITTFHWGLEFPEVFDRRLSGFDAFIGNPPFLGGSQLSELLGGADYQEWLKACNPGAFGNADLSAYFFRRAYELINPEGALGFLATKTICEGGTRTTGLQSILSAGGMIFSAVKSFRWPGEAMVVVSMVHIAGKNLAPQCERTLNGKSVKFINSRLLPAPEAADPIELSVNKKWGFKGAMLGGAGFVLDGDEYSRLAENSRNRDCLLPYLGGEELNRSPTQDHQRYAICFGSQPLEYAESYPDLLDIVRSRVKPERDKALDHGPGKHGKKYWWQYVIRADPLYKGIANLPRCIVTTITTAHLAFSFQRVDQVFPHSLVVFAFDRFSAFACLQSSIHNHWALMFSSYMGEGLRYSVSDAFHTFPFPESFLDDSVLEAIGREYYEHRARLMRESGEGLTKTYNKFHDPDNNTPEIQALRELHERLDARVLEAYGWPELVANCTYKFLSGDEGEDPDAGSREGKKVRWRYRWPNDFRDEVLGRLLELNAKRASSLSGSGMAANGGSSLRTAPHKSLESSGTEDLFS